MELKVNPGDSPEVIKRKERAIAKSKRDKKELSGSALALATFGMNLFKI